MHGRERMRCTDGVTARAAAAGDMAGPEVAFGVPGRDACVGVEERERG